ncbi:MAG: hypothetical protein ACFFG0_39220 [Candidatus Thorarchaeota archaeon]
MKNEKLEMKREVWEYFRKYRQAPFQKRYLELLTVKDRNKGSKFHN